MLLSPLVFFFLFGFQTSKAELLNLKIYLCILVKLIVLIWPIISSLLDILEYRFYLKTDLLIS